MVRKESAGDKTHNDELIEVKARLFENAAENIRPETIMDSRQILDKIVANETKAELFWTSDVAIYAMHRNSSGFDSGKHPALVIGDNRYNNKNPLICRNFHGEIAGHATSSFMESGKYEIEATSIYGDVFSDVSARNFGESPINLERLAEEIEPYDCNDKSMRIEFLIKTGRKNSELYIKDVVKKRFSNDTKTEMRKISDEYGQTINLLRSLFGYDYEESRIIHKLTEKNIGLIHFRIPSPKFVRENTEDDTRGLAYFCTLTILGDERKSVYYNGFNHGYHSLKPTIIRRKK